MAMFANLSLPALGALVFLGVLVVGVVCWVVVSQDRTERANATFLFGQLI